MTLPLSVWKSNENDCKNYSKVLVVFRREFLINGLTLAQNRHDTPIYSYPRWRPVITIGAILSIFIKEWCPGKMVGMKGE